MKTSRMRLALLAATMMLSLVVFVTGSARAGIIMTVTRQSSTVADIEVTGDVNATTGSYNPISSSRRYLLTLLHTDADPLFATLGASAPYTWNTGTTTLMHSTGGIPNTGSHYGAWNGGLGSSTEQKLNIAMSVNPSLDNTISGVMTDVTLPVGFTWGAVGQTGPLRQGGFNTGDSVLTIGTWKIVAVIPEPSTFLLAALGLLGLLGFGRGRRRN